MVRPGKRKAGVAVNGHAIRGTTVGRRRFEPREFFLKGKAIATRNGTGVDVLRTFIWE